MNAEETLKAHQPEVALFHKSSHSPSFATLTNNFERVHQLKDYCIPVNSYFPTEEIMQQLYQKMPYPLKYYPSNDSQLAEIVCELVHIADPDSVIMGNGSTELISWLNTLLKKIF
ncbi:MAG: hypothetical protein M3142_12400 [Bacteroidota bacterium]|nr:hypothetical protein [Bacteroidota bacterium]